MSLNCAPAGLKSIWVGPPGKLVQIPQPDSGISPTVGRGGTDHALISGGSTTTRRPRTKFAYPLAWSQMDQDTADAIVALYSGQMGVGPYVLADPSWRNMLDLDTSTFGGAVRQNVAWHAPDNSTPLIDLTQAPPTGVRSDVLRWTAPAAGASLWPGSRSGGTYAADLTRATPWIPGAGAKVSLYVKAAATPAATTMTLTGAGVEPSNLYSGTYNGTATLSLTTAWQRLTLDLSAKAWTQAQVNWLVPLLTTSAAPGTDILVAGAQIEYGATSTIKPYVQGLGCPRVVVGADDMAAGGTVWWRRTQSLTLLER